MVTYGMSPTEAILTSTSAAARLIGIDDQVGTLARGKEADLLLIDGNPLRKIEVLRDRGRIVGVMSMWPASTPRCWKRRASALFRNISALAKPRDKRTEVQLISQSKRR